uniref:hypothetical protein n=1 Tax=Campylobacter fetus TaxID=196 RepID=UPI003AF94C6C
MKKVVLSILVVLYACSAFGRDYKEKALSVAKGVLDVSYEYFGESFKKCYGGEFPTIEQIMKIECNLDNERKKYAPKVRKFMKKDATNDDAKEFLIGNFDSAVRLAMININNAMLKGKDFVLAANATLPMIKIVEAKEIEPNKFGVKYAVTNFQEMANIYGIMYDGIVYLSCKEGKCYVEPEY